MTLQTLTQIVGPINRGQLDVGFRADVEIESTVQKARSPISRQIGRVRPPPLTEDFSHLKSVHSNRGFQGRKMPLREIVRRVQPHLKGVYTSLYGRGSSPQKIADAIGVHLTSVTNSLLGRGSESLRARVKAQLTPEEAKDLQW